MVTVLNRRILVAWVLLLASTTWILFAEPKTNRKTDNNSSTVVSNDSYRGLSGEELWSNNCMRCHNIRPPTMYSNAQWDVIVHHMRLRANITGQEQRAIVEFLKSSQ
jgi:nitrate/TMAO reductase-like tetraheme cytochrome c subunit